MPEKGGLDEQFAETVKAVKENTGSATKWTEQVRLNRKLTEEHLLQELSSISGVCFDLSGPKIKDLEVRIGVRYNPLLDRHTAYINVVLDGAWQETRDLGLSDATTVNRLLRKALGPAEAKNA